MLFYSFNNILVSEAVSDVAFTITGMGAGGIIGIVVGFVATVVLVSFALYIYHKSRSENYAA